MSEVKTIKVTFDPGITQHGPVLEEDILEQISGASKLKAINQRKFQLQLLEGKVFKLLHTAACIYRGCVVYGSTLASKYKEPPAEIFDNPMLTLSKEERDELDLTDEPKFMYKIYQSLNKTISFNLKRKSKLPDYIEDCINTYIEFVSLNNHFLDLKTTDQLKLPEKTKHFLDYPPETIDKIEEKIMKIAKQGTIEEFLNIS